MALQIILKILAVSSLYLCAAAVPLQEVVVPPAAASAVSHSYLPAASSLLHEQDALRADVLSRQHILPRLGKLEETDIFQNEVPEGNKDMKVVRQLAGTLGELANASPAELSATLQE